MMEPLRHRDKRASDAASGGMSATSSHEAGHKHHRHHHHRQHHGRKRRRAYFSKVHAAFSGMVRSVKSAEGFARARLRAWVQWAWGVVVFCVVTTAGAAGDANVLKLVYVVFAMATLPYALTSSTYACWVARRCLLSSPHARMCCCGTASREPLPQMPAASSPGRLRCLCRSPQHGVPVALVGWLGDVRAADSQPRHCNEH